MFFLVDDDLLRGDVLVVCCVIEYFFCYFDLFGDLFCVSI